MQKNADALMVEQVGQARLSIQGALRDIDGSDPFRTLPPHLIEVILYALRKSDEVLSAVETKASVVPGHTCGVLGPCRPGDCPDR